jgi:hypothetical protein
MVICRFDCVTITVFFTFHLHKSRKKTHVYSDLSSGAYVQKLPVRFAIAITARTYRWEVQAPSVWVQKLAVVSDVCSNVGGFFLKTGFKNRLTVTFISYAVLSRPV